MNHPNASISRRGLFQTAATAGAASMLLSDPARGDEAPAHAPDAARADHPAPRGSIVDTNITLFQWPFRRLPLDDVDALLHKLRDLGIAQAWAGSFEGLLHRDITAVNRRLAETCRRYPELVPIGSINPTLPDWQEDLRRCIEDHDMPGVRLHPNYHGYGLDDPRFAQLLDRAAESGRLVQIAAAMEDTRTQHPSLRAEEVDLTPLASLMRQRTAARVQILNARLRTPLLQRLTENAAIWFDTARVEGTDGVAELLRTVSADRVMFGSHAPFLIPEAALIRVHESDLDEEPLGMLLSANAHQVRSQRDS